MTAPRKTDARRRRRATTNRTDRPSRLRVAPRRPDSASTLPGPVPPELDAKTASPEATVAPSSAAEEEAAYRADLAAGFPCRCGRTWTGATRCHCATCHASFTSVTAFDRHRRGFECRPPGECGLVLRGDYWSLPGEWHDVSDHGGAGQAGKPREQ